MRSNLNYRCDQHPNQYDCPDQLIAYLNTSQLYGLIIHDGGTSFIKIAYCPWCGASLQPEPRENGPDGELPVGAVPIT